MHSKLKLLLTAGIATVALAAMISTAGAASFSIEPAGHITSESLGELTFAEPSIGLGPKCVVTLGGELHEGTIDKVIGALLGLITEGSVVSCSTGSATIIQRSFPWHITYEGIQGTLPSAVESVDLSLDGAEFLISFNTIFFGTIECQYGGNANGILGAVGRNPYTTGLITSDEEAGIPLTNESLNNAAISCPAEGFLEGILSLSPEQTVTRI